MADVVMVHPMVAQVTETDVEAFLATQRSRRTAAAYRRDLTLFQRFVESADLAEPVLGLELYRSWLLASGDAPSTVRRRMASAAGFLRWRDGIDVPTPPMEVTASRTTSLGLGDMAALIGGVDGPETAREGVACLLFASKVATVDGLIALGPEHLGAGLRMTIDGTEVRFPRSLRGTLELLLRSADGGRVFGGMSRQTLTRRIRTFAASCGVDDCTPRSLRRSSGQITVEALALLESAPIDPQRIRPQERLELIVDAIRARLASS